ncbi:MAG: SRPBCC domain-containing protein, partial [Actinomycetota bacterium]
GSMHQFDYRIDEREGGGSTIRYVHSGMLGGDWEAEYEAMSEGDPMYLAKLAEYVTYFSGRFATPIDTHGPNVPDREQALETFRRALGLPGSVAEGDQVHLTPEGLAPIDGVIDHVSPSFLGVRSSDALYRFIYGFDGTTMVGHHLFDGAVDQQQAERAWASWLANVFGGAGTASG